MVYDRERITKIIKDIEKFSSDLDGLEIKSAGDLGNKEKYYAASMLVFSIINRLIDLGDEVVASSNIGVPSKYREIFTLLCRNKYIPEALAEKLSELVYYRNLISHEYHDINEKDVFRAIKKITVANEFVDKVKKALEKYNG
jgi:uncharacterized protein YutE (UPF0331/DUF86 family)